MDDASEHQRDKRSGVIIRAAIDTGSAVVERRVRNLSIRGACVDHDGELKIGQSVRLTMGRLPEQVAEVMWVKDKLAGLQFAAEIDVEAARAPRGAGSVNAGWMKDINHAYRRRG
jgi:hypothetical protein